MTLSRLLRASDSLTRDRPSLGPDPTQLLDPQSQVPIGPGPLRPGPSLPGRQGVSCSPFTFLKVLLFFLNCLENSDFHILKVRSVFIIGNLENKVLSADSKGHRLMGIFSLPAFCLSSSQGVWTSPLQFH